MEFAEFRKRSLEIVAICIKKNIDFDVALIKESEVNHINVESGRASLCHYQLWEHDLGELDEMLKYVKKKVVKDE